MSEEPFWMNFHPHAWKCAPAPGEAATVAAPDPAEDEPRVPVPA